MQMRRYGIAWGREDKLLLTELWNERDLSARAIGRIMMRTSNAIIGMAHRMKMNPRASPIKRKLKMSSVSGKKKYRKNCHEVVHRHSKLVREVAIGPVSHLTAPDVASDRCLCGNQAVPKHAVCYECAGHRHVPRPVLSQGVVVA